MPRFHLANWRCGGRGISLLIAIVIIGLGVSVASAGPFSKLYVFGDSLSDIGNVASASFGIYPGQYYWNDRFSNGPVWVESLDTGLGLAPLVRSTSSGGTDFAYGGAQTSGTGGLDGIFIKDVDEQLNQFLPTSTTKVDSKALYVVFAGANDLINGQTNVSVPVGRLNQDLGRLVNAGARNFLVANLPLLGYTPRYNDSPTTFASYNTLTTQFNSALDVVLNNLQAGNSALAIHRLDVASLFSQAIANPAAFGLTNVTDSAAPGLEPGDSSYNTAQIVSNPNQYLFWDDLHPTATVHAALAQFALEQLMLPGDFNRDGHVNAADITVMQQALANIGDYQAAHTDLSGADLLSIEDVNGDKKFTAADLQALLTDLRTGGGNINPVPEPASFGLLLISLVGSMVLFKKRVRLSAGVIIAALVCMTGSWSAFSYADDVAPSTGMAPVADFPKDYKGTPFTDAKYKDGAQKIPGKLMCAYYDIGGEGVAYYDKDAKNQGSGGLNPLDGKYLNEFRANEGVDISYTKDAADFWEGEAVQPPKEMLYVGWTEPGEWVNYTVDVAEDGDYTVDILYTSNRGGVISLDVNGKPLDKPIVIASTNDPKDTTSWRQWHHWNIDKDAATVKLSKGRNLLTVHVVEKGNMNLGILEFKLLQK